MKTIKDYQIEYLDCCLSDYFQGYGTYCTNYDHCATGIGDNTAETYNDALEKMADTHDFTDLDKEMPCFAKSGLPEVSIPEQAEDVNETPYIYVGIRYNFVMAE